MALIAAKCTQCGANIEVDKSREAGICPHCGTAFITEKVINNYSITYNITKFVTDETKVEDWIEDSQLLIKMGEWQRALDALRRITVDCPQDYRGWFHTAKLMYEMCERGNAKYAQEMYSCIVKAYKFGKECENNSEMEDIEIYYARILKYHIERVKKAQEKTIKAKNDALDKKASDKKVGLFLNGVLAVLIIIVIVLASSLPEFASTAVFFCLGTFAIMLTVSFKYFHLMDSYFGYDMRIEEYEKKIEEMQKEIDSLS